MDADTLVLAAEERRERRLVLSEELRIATQLGLDARNKMKYWEDRARLAKLELDVLTTLDGSYQTLLA